LEVTTVDTPAEANWTAFQLSATADNEAGHQFNKISNTVVTNAGVGIEIDVSGQKGYINSNTFEFLRLWAGRTFIQFNLSENRQVVQGNSPIMSNLFSNIHCECQAADADPQHPYVQTQIGIANVVGEKNTFFEVNVWDIQRAIANAKSLEITNRALNTLIIGGLFAVLDDHGQNTVTVGTQI
jgi:hypothetical protein